MTDLGRRFMTWLTLEKNIKNIGEYLVLPTEKRVELRKEFFAKEGVKTDE